MKNEEKWNEQLQFIWCHGLQFGVDKYSGEPFSCCEGTCEKHGSYCKCAFAPIFLIEDKYVVPHEFSCSVSRTKWMDEEYKEPTIPASKLIHDCRIIVNGQNFHFCKFSEGTLWYYPKGYSAWTIKNDKTALILCINPYNENNVYLSDGTRVIME